MDEHNLILNEIEDTGLFEVMTVPTPDVLSAMAHAADPKTRKLKKSFDEIARQVDKIAGRMGNRLFPDQVEGAIHLLSESGIVEKVTEGPLPTYRIAGYHRLAEIKSEIDERIAAGGQPFPHVPARRTNATQR